MKHSRLFAIAASAAVLASVACTGISEPAGWASPVAVNDLLIVTNHDGGITGLRTSGTDKPAVVWSFPPENQRSSGGLSNFVKGLFTRQERRQNFSAVYATPLVETVGNQPRVYVASYAGDVVALNAADGKPVSGWPANVNIGGHVAATPGFDGKRLYVPTHHGDVRTVDATAGTVSEPLVRTEARVWSEPVLSGGTLYVSSLDHRVRAIDPATRAVRWTADVGGAVAGNPTVAGELLLVPTLQSRVVALELRSGEQRWAHDGDNWYWARPLVSGNTVFVASTRGTVEALDPVTGSTKWQYSGLQDEVRAMPVMAAGALVIASRNGHIVALDPATGAERWRKQLEKTRFLADPLVLESGVLYSAEDGSLYRVTAQDQGTADLLYKRGS